MNAAAAPPSAGRRLGATAALAVLAFALYGAATLKPLDHDEHQFVTSAALLARDGLLPYRDAPYNHLPYQSLMLAPLLDRFGSLLATARAFSVACSLGIVALLWHAARRYGPAPESRPALAFRTAAIIALVANPLFFYTSGRAWNHDLSVMLTLAAALTHIAWLKEPERIRAMIASGLLLGAACGVRSSYALAIPPFVACVALLGPADLKQRLRATVAFGLAGVGVLLPVAGFFALAPEEFAYGNFTYNLELNTAYREAMRWEVAMDLPGKLAYLRDEVLSHRRNFWLLAAYAVALVAVLAGRSRAQHLSAHAFVLFILSGLFLGAWSPTPTWYQYFYPLAPFMVLGLVLLAADHEAMRGRPVAALAGAALMLTSLAGMRHYGASMTAPPDERVTVQMKRIGDRVAASVPDGVVLTLAPLPVLEGGAEIDPAFATGPFQWRTAWLADPEDRSAAGIVGPDELEAHLDGNRPAALLLGAEHADGVDTERGLREWASANGYAPESIDEHLSLWLPRQ